jgi:hypothetical protein
MIGSIMTIAMGILIGLWLIAVSWLLAGLLLSLGLLAPLVGALNYSWNWFKGLWSPA